MKQSLPVPGREGLPAGPRPHRHGGADADHQGVATAPPAAALLRLQRSAGNSAVSGLLTVQREWVASPDAPLYQAATGDQLTMGVPRYTRITVVDRQPAPGSTRWLVRIGKAANPHSDKENLSKFERAFRNQQGYMEAADVTDTFPRADDFPIPDLDRNIPPLYHGADRDSLENIKRTGFVVTPKPKAGRSYGDGVYATPYVTKAAVHGFGAAAVPGYGPEFAVGKVSRAWFPSKNPPRILVHDQVSEGQISDSTVKDEGLRHAALARKVVEYMHGAQLAAVADSLVPPSEAKAGISKVEITAAARKLGYDVVVYTGYPGDVVYVLLNAQDWRVERTVLEGQTNATDSLSFPEDLDWFHEATDRDRTQGALNAL